MPNIVKLRPAWRNYWVGLLVVGVLLGISAWAAIVGSMQGKQMGAVIWFVLALLFLGFIAFKRYSWKFTIDNATVSRHYGIIARNQQRAKIKDLRSIELNQGLFQRIFNVGDLSFYTAGSPDAEVVFCGIKDPTKLRDEIDNMV